MTRSNPPDPRIAAALKAWYGDAPKGEDGFALPEVRMAYTLAAADAAGGVPSVVPDQPGERVACPLCDEVVHYCTNVGWVVPDPTPEPPAGWTKRTEYRTQGYGTLTSNGAMGHTGLIGDIDFRQEQRTVHEGPWGAWPAVTTDPETTEER